MGTPSILFRGLIWRLFRIRSTGDKEKGVPASLHDTPILALIDHPTISLPSRSSPWPWVRRRPAAPANDRPRRPAS
jgi:hypothetical protein